MQRYSWPGNVRELRNTVERVMIMHQNHRVGVKDLLRLARKSRRRPLIVFLPSKKPAMPIIANSSSASSMKPAAMFRAPLS